MTSAAAWLAVDSRGPSAFYLASDSRISWEHLGGRWDFGRKLFASRNFPDIFGYCGDVLFPSLALGQALSLADKRVLFAPDDGPLIRHQKLITTVKFSFGSYPPEVRRDFTILHASRENSGMASQFYFWSLEWSPSRGWASKLLDLPKESVLVLAVGSGKQSLMDWNREWRERLGRTSRSVFGSFCDSLRSRQDPNSGGAPQLVGIYRTGAARSFGVIYDKQRFLFGMPITDECSCDSAEWRNCLFERCDGRTMERLESAQPQPRPDRNKQW